jgi:hypothetical protein
MESHPAFGGDTSATERVAAYSDAFRTVSTLQRVENSDAEMADVQVLVPLVVSEPEKVPEKVRSFGYRFYVQHVANPPPSRLETACNARKSLHPYHRHSGLQLHKRLKLRLRKTVTLTRLRMTWMDRLVVLRAPINSATFNFLRPTPNPCGRNGTIVMMRAN